MSKFGPAVAGRKRIFLFKRKSRWHSDILEQNQCQNGDICHLNFPAFLVLNSNIWLLTPFRRQIWALGGVRKERGLTKSGSVFDIGAHIFQFREYLREKAGIRIDTKHGCAQAIDNIDTSVPKAILVWFHKEWFQRIANLVSHVTEKIKNYLKSISSYVIQRYWKNCMKVFSWYLSDYRHFLL